MDENPTPQPTPPPAQNPPAAPPAATPAASPKPGVKTSEFWLLLAVILLGTLGPAGLLAAIPESWARLVAYALAVLAAAGYTYQRARLKLGGPPTPPDGPDASSPTRPTDDAR